MIFREPIPRLWRSMRPGWISITLLTVGLILLIGLLGKFEFDARKDVPTSLALDTENPDWQAVNKVVEFPGFYGVWLEIDHHQIIGDEGCLLDLATYGGQKDGDPNCKLKPLAKDLDIRAFRDGKELENWNEPGGAIYGKMLQIKVGGGGRSPLAKGDRIRAAIRLPKGWSALASFHPTLAIERSENANDTEVLYLAIQVLVLLVLLASIFVWIIEVTVRHFRSRQNRNPT